MKKIYLIVTLLASFNLANSQIYSATTETGFRHNPANDSIAVFDDILLNVGSPNAGANVKITQLQVGFRRLANAQAVDVALYLGRMSSTRVPFTADSIFQTSLPANGATSVTSILTANSATGWTVNLDTISGNNTNRGFFVGLRQRGSGALDPNQGWRICNAPTVGSADSTFFYVNVINSSLGGPYFFSGTRAYFYTIVTGTINVVTPVKLSFFKASYFGEGASIFWNVENEINFKEYVIERSFDGVNFDIYDRVPAKNSKSYEFKVAKLLAGKNYFRLKMIDKDGKFEYSKVELLESRTIKSNFNILPNPVATSLNFNWTEDGIYRFQLLGIDGKQFKLGPVLKGMNTIDVSSLNSGTYVLDVINAKGEVIAAKKVYKQ